MIGLNNSRLPTSGNSLNMRLDREEPTITDSYSNLNLASPTTNQIGGSEFLQDDFTLLDVIGGAGISVLHPTKPIVAYTSGCIIIVFDLLSDTKI